MKRILLLSLLLSACGGGDGSRLAPPFVLPGVSGGTESLEARRGQVVLVAFWATWCESCREEMPLLQDMRARRAAEGFEILAISLDDDPRKAVPPFARELKLSFPMLAGDRAVAAAYAVRGLPTMFLVDREGRVARRYFGALDARALENDILSLLKRRPA
jgi:peroxiredoxin